MVKKYLNNSIFLSVLILLFVLYSGNFRIPSKYKITSLLDYKNAEKITGKIVSSPVKTSNGKNYLVYLDIIEICSNKIKASAFGRTTLIVPAEIIEAFYPGKLYTTAKNKGSYLWESGGIFTVQGSYSNDIFLVKKCLNGIYENSLQGKIDLFRALCRLQFKRLMYSWGKGGGLLLALSSGAKEYTENELSEAFKSAGLSHILALSGMHLSMFSGIAIFIGKRFRRKKLTFIIRIIALIFFVWFAGLSPSLLRAFICSFLIIFSKMVNSEEPDIFLILCFSFIIQIIIMPDCWLNIGFILSYGALAGILLFNNEIRKYLNLFFPGYFSASISSSVSAQFFTAPISLKIFRSFAPVGIIATSIISPIITIFIYSGLVLIIISLSIPVFSVPSGIFMNFLYNIIKYMVEIFAKCPLITI